MYVVVYTNSNFKVVFFISFHVKSVSSTSIHERLAKSIFSSSFAGFILFDFTKTLKRTATYRWTVGCGIACKITRTLFMLGAIHRLTKELWLNDGVSNPLTPLFDIVRKSYPSYSWTSAMHHLVYVKSDFSSFLALYFSH